jgi:hypothetical protein
MTIKGNDYSRMLKSKKALECYRNFPDVCNAILKSFSFLVHDYGFEVDHEGIPRGWSLAFKRENMTIIAGQYFSGLTRLPNLVVWLDKKDEKHLVFRSFDDLIDDMNHGFSKSIYEYTSTYNELGLLRGILFKKKYGNELEKEFYKRLKDAGEFIKQHFDEIIAFFNDPSNGRTLAEIRAEAGQ